MRVHILCELYNLQETDSHLCYRFKYTLGICNWPLKNGKGLGSCGMWNFLRRLGFHPSKCFVGNLPVSTDGDVLFVQADCKFDESTLEFLNGWLILGGKIVAAGSILAWKDFFGRDVQLKETEYENPYAALAYLFPDEKPQIIAPQKWTFAVCKNNDMGVQFSGRIAAVHGERQTPSRALISPIEDAPAMIVNGRFVYLNGNPFAAFQAWLQGQEDLNPWMAWRHRLFWLDELVSFLGLLLFDTGVLSRSIERDGIKGLSETTIVLKHDLDHSTDTAYLKEETRRGLHGTHAVLKDKNALFWINTLNQNMGHEIAFHYNTSTRNWINEAKRFLLRKKPGTIIPATRQIFGKGLLNQIKWAKRKGIGIKTLHRHSAFLLYPEWIDALNEVFEIETEVLGSNSLFRAHVLRWGVERIDGNNGYVGEWPDAQFPFWFPFKVAHAGLGGKILRGWESTSIMETEPDLFNQILDYKIKELPQRVITVNFHPAHANKPTFCKKGSLSSFVRILDTIKERNLTVIPLSTVYQLADASLSK